MMPFDTATFIRAQRGNAEAADLIESAGRHCLTAQPSKDFLITFAFVILLITENISHRAGDSIIAATATENNLTLVTSSTKHFRSIKDRGSA